MTEPAQDADDVRRPVRVVTTFMPVCGHCHWSGNLYYDRQMAERAGWLHDAQAHARSDGTVGSPVTGAERGD